ncbi:hypothetical protein Tco_1202982 [Tanacetum coccineum]
MSCLVIRIEAQVNIYDNVSGKAGQRYPNERPLMAADISRIRLVVCEKDGRNSIEGLYRDCVDVKETPPAILDVVSVGKSFALKELRLNTLRFMQRLICRDGEKGENHSSLYVLAMKAWLGLGRYGGAEKDLEVPRIGDRRIRRLSAYKHWKAASKTNMYRNKKSCYKYQRSIRDYPFKKRRLYQFDSTSNSNHQCDFIEDGTSLSAFHDSHVKLNIKSFRLRVDFDFDFDFVTAILSGELQVGVMLQGKRIRDDNKTLLQTGICHDNVLDALDFTLESNGFQVEDLPMVH